MNHDNVTFERGQIRDETYVDHISAQSNIFRGFVAYPDFEQFYVRNWQKEILVGKFFIY